jgi:hypothetical protein
MKRLDAFSPARMMVRPRRETLMTTRRKRQQIRCSGSVAPGRTRHPLEDFPPAVAHTLVSKLESLNEKFHQKAEPTANFTRG